MVTWSMLAVAILLPFIGKPTHLACDFQDAGAAPAIDVVVAPSRKAVALTILPTGHVERHQATLSGAALTFDSPLPYGNVNYAINRADLSIVRTEGGPAVPTVITKGRCRLEDAPALAF